MRKAEKSLAKEKAEAERLRAAALAREAEQRREAEKQRSTEQARQEALDRAAEEAREAREAAARRSYLVRPASGAPARYQKIYDLADQGLNREQIAKNAGILPGEVDLILNLRRKN